jgi:hypothetical protein
MFRGPSDRGAPAVDQMPETRVRAIFLKRAFQSATVDR